MEPPKERSPRVFRSATRYTSGYTPTRRVSRRFGALRLPAGASSLRWLATAPVFMSLFTPWFWIDFGGYYRLTVGPFYADVTVGMPGSFTLTTRVEGFSFTRVMVLLLTGLILGGHAAYSGSRISAIFSGLSLAMALGIFITALSSSIPEMLGFIGTLLGTGTAPQTQSLWGKKHYRPIMAL